MHVEAAGLLDWRITADEPSAVPIEKHLLQPFGLSVAAPAFEDAVEHVIGWARDADLGRFVCLANVHMLVEATRHHRLLTALQEADLVLPDGMPLVWMMSRQVDSVDRIAGMDLLPALCRRAAAAKIPVFVWGGRSETLRAVRARLEREHPEIRIAGMRAAGLGRLPRIERQRALDEIAASRARLVFVGLGCPRQELWMHRHRDSVRAVMVGVGGALDVFAGLRRRAPQMLQRLGLEWAYRLIQDPRRMGPRYFDTNTAFGWLLLRHWLLGPSRNGNGPFSPVSGRGSLGSPGHDGVQRQRPGITITARDVVAVREIADAHGPLEAKLASRRIGDGAR